MLKVMLKTELCMVEKSNFIKLNKFGIMKNHVSFVDVSGSKVQLKQGERNVAIMVSTLSWIPSPNSYLCRTSSSAY